MSWLSSQEEVPLVDCWDVAGDGTTGWTWERQNPLTQSGPLLESDQRVDVIYTSKRGELTVSGSSSFFKQNSSFLMQNPSF